MLPLGERAPDTINVIVEIPSGSRNKYEYDKSLDIFRLDRALHSPVYYPGDYGFVPRTLALDDDPLDVLILVSEPTFSGCLVVARPIGILGMTDFDEQVATTRSTAVPVGEQPSTHRHRYLQADGHAQRSSRINCARSNTSSPPTNCSKARRPRARSRAWSDRSVQAEARRDHLRWKQTHDTASTSTNFRLRLRSGGR